MKRARGPTPTPAAVLRYAEVLHAGHRESSTSRKPLHRTINMAAISGGRPTSPAPRPCVKTGKPHWTYDLKSHWGSPCLVEDKIYLGDQLVFQLFWAKLKPPATKTVDVQVAVYSTPGWWPATCSTFPRSDLIS